MSVALDVGSHEMRSLRSGRERLVARRCGSVYCLLEDLTSHRSLLEQVGIPYAACEDRLVVFGPQAEQFTRAFRIPQRELFPEGRVPLSDPLARQLLGTLVEALIGRAERAGQLCSVIIPGENKGGEQQSCGAFLCHLVELQGYTPLPVRAPHAVVLACLHEKAFTGIGLSFGAGTSEAALVHRGNLLAFCAVPYAGNWIDLRLARARQLFVWDAAGAKLLDTARSRSMKESFAGSLTAPATPEEQLLSDLHRGMLEFLLQQAAESFAPVLARFRLSGPLTAVVAGGCARGPQFQELTQQVLASVSFPVPVSEVRLAAESDLVAARGGLIRAELETAGDIEPAPAAA